MDEQLNELAEAVHAQAVKSGFYDDPVEFGTRIALIHSELSEALEAHLDGWALDGKLPAFSSVAIELADVIIRTLDLAAYCNIKIGDAISAKIAYNKTRPYKHGKDMAY
jgi:NTP pyrophosphatase (non-canonical NTP hydrolase)